jgi:hypothetical protein
MTPQRRSATALQNMSIEGQQAISGAAEEGEAKKGMRLLRGV